MNIKNFLLVSIAGAISLFILGFLLYGLLLGGTSDYDASMGWRTEPVFVYIFLFNWAAAMLVTLILGHWGSVSGFKGGATVGVIFGILWSLSYSLGMMAFRTDMVWNDLLIGLVVDAVMFAIAGGLMGMLLQRLGGRANVGSVDS